MDVDENAWEYNCPQFVDFSNPDALPQADDKEFFSVAASVKEEDFTAPVASEKPQATSNSGPSNVYSSLDAWNRTGASKSTDSSKPVAVDKRINGQSSGKAVLVKQASIHPPSKKVEHGRNSLKRSRSSANTKQQEEIDCPSPAAKSIKRSNSVKSLSDAKSFQRSNSSSDLASRKRLTRSTSNSTLAPASSSFRLTRTTSRDSLRDRSVRDRSLEVKPTANREKKMATLTVATSPTFLSRLRKKCAGKAQTKTTEEIEIEQTAMMRKALQDKLKKNQHGYKKALALPAFPSAAPQLANTVVQEFHFHTDKKVRTHTMETRSETKDFAQTLRSNSQPHQKQLPQGCMTVVQPFNLTESKKRPEENTGACVFKSMAETIKDFHRRTPDRFRTKLKDPSPRMRSKSPPHKLTLPKTPSLETRSRSRPVHAPSQEELEEQELEMIKQNQFKAHPVNPKIFTHGRLGLKKVESKPVTQVEEFSLTSDQRVKVNSTTNKDKEEKFEFHARPAPAKILEGVVGVKPAKKVVPTVPHSPALSVKLRARLPRLQPEQEEECVAVLRRPVPHTGVPFQPHLPHKHSVVEPFQFDERDKERWAKKEEKLKQIAEEQNKVRDFVANPLPESVISREITLPAKQPKPATVPQPFNLELDKRGKKRQEEFKHKVEEEVHHLKELTKFKAQDSSVIHKEPFVPKKTGRQLCDITEFRLNTELRAKARENYEQCKKDRQMYMDACQREQEMRRMDEEKAAISQMRQEMVHRANPIRHYKAVEIQACTKPITQPLTPKLCTARRLRSNTDNSISN
ncbi:targeting protein for Xklp2-A-like [Liolophura sinensis]|uniref:targeting protein for Xklp2-A-like n=1 Tax=Liolophura sinensis TaxID=3198878 RepID=UPI0031585948